jgi:hypothetical protein
MALLSVIKRTSDFTSVESTGFHYVPPSGVVEQRLWDAASVPSILVMSRRQAQEYEFSQSSSPGHEIRRKLVSRTSGCSIWFDLLGDAR